MLRPTVGPLPAGNGTTGAGSLSKAMSYVDDDGVHVSHVARAEDKELAGRGVWGSSAPHLHGRAELPLG